jgi:hypothetical protein
MALQEQHALKFMPRAVFDGKFNVYSSLKDLEGQVSLTSDIVLTIAQLRR